CGKDKTTELTCKLSKSIHITSGYSDTTIYTYSGDDLIYTVKYSNSSTLYTYKYIKSGSQYNYEIYYDAVKKYDGFARLNAQGKIDTTRVTNLTTTLFNNRNRSYYDIDGKVLRAISNYNLYENDVKYYYTPDGNYAYWIYDFYDYRPMPVDTKDSVVFEYYTDKLKKAEKFGFESKFGNLEKNLVKKRYYYDLFNSGNLRRTYEYEYLTNADGFVTREIWIIKNQPGDIETRRDTTYYEYICN
ncbi:MAG: hypothetical protein U0T69_14495, partial [Chitinophagales bacterium]